jgi:gamma-glutamyltranspeptidase
MKKNILILFVVLTIGLLVGCGGNVQNEFLGEVPSIAKHYDNKIEAKEKAMEDCTDMAEAFKLEKEKKKLKKERSAKIKEYVAANPFKPLPFEVLPGTAFTVKEAAITKYGSLRLSLTVDKDIKNKNGGLESRLTIYFKAVDSNGNEIQNTKNAATRFGGKALKAGSECDLSSPWPMRYMEDFAKLVQITEQEYNGQ